MNPPSARRHGATARRGMLLLLVLSILALFIVVGAVGILLALRARETARAFAAATANQAASGALARAQLDEALLKLIRGPSQAGALGQDVTESLLEDKYGALGTSGTVTALSGTTSAYITATVTGTGLDLSNPAAVAGRVLTFVPAAGDPTGPTSYRILRTGTVANTLLLANVKPNTPLPLPTVTPTTPCEAVINGREFSNQGPNEPYDAFDDQNPFLTVVGSSNAWPALVSSTIASVWRPAFGMSGTTCQVDNDGDGVPDGVWLDNILPPQTSPNGGQLSFSVSYLVLDLDGRINLNAHGSFVRAQIVESANTYPKDPTTFPVGMGFGPADVDAARLVAAQAELTGTPTSVPATWALLLQGGAVTTRATVSTGTQWRPTPRAEATQAGRYGSSVGPGNSALMTGANPANADYWMLNPVGNSPTDLKARLQVFTEGSPPTLKFARPSGAAAWAAAADTEDIQASGAAAHPYALRLDEDAPRAAGGNAVDAPYTVGELEWLLRPFDADTATLAPRLAAMLDDVAERSRMTVTTDSWDTPAVTGTTTQRIAASVTGGNAYDVLSPETIAGLRFNLNRPLASAVARQEYFKQLYTLILAVAGTSVSPAEAAQWAANVIEFRDPDSIMSWYPYDETPFDGNPPPPWTTANTGTGVWGIERPEIVITQATASGNQVSVSLYRPWNAHLCLGNTTTATGTTERIDASLGNAAANTLDATLQVSGSTAVWQLVAGGSATGLKTLLSAATAVPPNTAVGPALLTLGTPPTEVVLQRLADPAKALGASLSTGAGTNAYVDVHRVTVPQAGRTLSRWLHWPNRDLVSHGELLAVQSGAATVAEALFDESKEASLARTNPAILEATIVPSRFAATNVSVAGGALANTGFENLQYGQYSRWREAGRVNVNTIVPNTGNSPSTLDNAVWTALVGLSDTGNPVTASGTYAPIKSDWDLLVAGGDARFTRSGPEAASAFLKRSTAVRLANCATIRSHVFAVWITLRITDSSPNGGAPQFARLFAIVDRSIPVGYAAGRTLNVRETIRLQRFLQ